MELEWYEALCRIIAAAACGCLVGSGRERNNQAAGLGTYGLVSMAGAAVSVLSIFVSAEVGYTDLGRLPAAFIAGMGFLGTATIYRNSNQEAKGLTTAAGLLSVAVGGLCMGMGYWTAGAAVYVISALVIEVLEKLDPRLPRVRDTINLYAEIGCRSDLKQVLSAVAGLGASISDIRTETVEGGGLAVTLRINENGSTTTGQIIDSVRALDCVSFALCI